MSGLSLFARLTKIDEAKRQVTGVVATETPDHAGEIFDYATSKPFFAAWSSNIAKTSDGKSVGNLRVMHGLTAAGKFSEIEMNDAAKTITATAEIVDDQEWKKVLAGVYTGFSFGGKYVKKWNDGTYKRYTGNPNEVSLVDSPCIPDATFSIHKIDGTVVEHAFTLATTEEAAPAAATEPAAEVTKTVREQFIAEHGLVDVADTVTVDQLAQAVVIAKLCASDSTDAAHVEKVAELRKAVDAAAKITVALRKTNVEKGLYSTGCLGNIVQDLAYLTDGQASEAEMEGDNSPIPEQLRTALKALGDILVEMTREEVAELLARYAEPQIVQTATVAQMATPVGEVQKILLEDIQKSIEDADEEELRKFARHLLTVNEEMDKGIAALAKVLSTPPDTKSLLEETQRLVDAQAAKKDEPEHKHEDIHKVNAALDETSKTLRKVYANNTLLKSQVDYLSRENERLKALPPAEKTPRLRAVSKGDDVVQLEDPVEKIAPVIDNGEVNTVATAIKKIHAQGGVRLM